MLVKNFDLVIVGKSYLSVLLAMKLIKRGQKVLLLDDERVEIGTLFSDFFGPIEKKFIESWASDNAMESFSDIEKLLTPKPYSFVIENKRIRLGRAPSANFYELYRKLNSLLPLSEEEFTKHVGTEQARELFDNEFYKLTDRIGKSSYFFKSLQGLNIDGLLAMCPKGIVDLYNAFSKVVIKRENLSEKDLWFLKSFLVMTRGLFHKCVDSKLNETEAFHLLLCLLSPSYELDHEKALEEIIPVFEKAGGIYKCCQLREWKFHNSKPWSVELSSYEGIVHPEKIVFIGGDLTQMPVTLNERGKTLKDICVEWQIDGLPDPLLGERIFFSRVDKMGTDIPLWCADVEEGKLKFKVFSLFEKGSKISFIKDHLRQSLKEDLSVLYPEVRSFRIREKISYGKELWPYDLMRTDKRSWFPKKVSLFDGSRPGVNEKLKNVHYFGPRRQTPLGLLSSLMDLNEMQQFI